MLTLGRLLVSAIVGVLVVLIGSMFDPTPGNRDARIAGLIVFVLVFIGWVVI